MRTLCILAAAAAILISCNGDENPSQTRLYVLANVDFKSNITTYDYPDKKLDADFYYASQESSTVIIGAFRNGNYSYISTANPQTLRKVDLNSGSEVASTKSWVQGGHAMAFHGSDLILQDLNYDGATPYSSIKIYDDNLVLQDSIVTEGVFRLDAIVVVGDRLFSSVTVANVGAFIQIYDFNSSTFLDPIQFDKIVLNLFPVNNNKLLAIMNDSYLTIDPNNFNKGEIVPSNISKNPSVFDSKENTVIWLEPTAQPSLIPSMLRSTNLTTGEVSTLHERMESMIGPVAYDDKSGLVFCGPGLKIYSKGGDLLDEVALSAQTKYIFVK
jgi:hypothetical protein